VVCLDIDHFKQVNDRFGHQTGDVVLTQVAQALRSQVRPTDMLARTGGEEFVVLVHDEPATGLLMLAERLRTAVARAVRTPDGQPVHISLGVARCTATDAQAENVLSRADAALYRAKQQGRNRVEASPELVQTPA
jgi:diguanylate cyclase